MAEPVRVLHVFGRLGLGGAETRTVDLLRHMDRNLVQFDFLVHTQEASFYDAEVTGMGAHIYRVSRFRGTNLGAYLGETGQFFKTHRGIWRVVQGHMTSTASLYLPYAKRYGAARTAAHARSAGVERGMKGVATKALEYPLRTMKAVDDRFAVSRKAGEAVFGKYAVKSGRVRILANAIDTVQFVHDAGTRARMRGTLGIPQDALVIGHVGRFHYAKNHEFLLRVFAETKRMCQPAKNAPLKLLLIGEGSRMDGMRALARSLGLEKDTVFAGNRSDIHNCYQAMDVFVYPSRYEGMPGVVIEAQASGLRCLISDTITDEADITELVARMSLTLPPENWARETLAALKIESDRIRQSGQAREALRRAGFDVRAQAQMMTDYYTGKQVL